MMNHPFVTKKTPQQNAFGSMRKSYNAFTFIIQKNLQNNEKKKQWKPVEQTRWYSILHSLHDGIMWNSKPCNHQRTKGWAKFIFKKDGKRCHEIINRILCVCARAAFQRLWPTILIKQQRWHTKLQNRQGHHTKHQHVPHHQKGSLQSAGVWQTSSLQWRLWSRFDLIDCNQCKDLLLRELGVSEREVGKN